jgi:hypothetical protein
VKNIAWPPAPKHTVSATKLPKDGRDSQLMLRHESALCDLWVKWVAMEMVAEDFVIPAWRIFASLGGLARTLLGQRPISRHVAKVRKASQRSLRLLEQGSHNDHRSLVDAP